MPRVPRAEEQVREAPLPGAQFATEAPAAAFGGGQAPAAAAEAARGLARDVAAFAAEERDAADSLVVQQADLETAREKLRLLKDPKTGALNVRGQETLGLPDTVGAAFEKSVESVRGRLSTRQRGLYDRLLLGHKRDLNDQLQGHIFSEMRKFDESATTARLETAREEATLSFHDPAKISAKIEEQKSLLRARADRADLAGAAIPPEELKRQQAEAASKTQAAVLARLLTAGEDQHARAYYEQVKNDLTAADAQRVEQALRAGTVLGESQRRAGDLILKHGDEKPALEAAREIADPDIQKATVDELRTRYAEQRRLEKQAADEALQQAANVVEQSGDARLVPRPLWAQLSAGERHALETRSRQIREGIEPVTDWPTYYELKTLASSDATRAAFLRENLLEKRPQLADVEFKELTGLQASLRQGGDEASRKAMDGYRTKASIVNDALNSIDIDPTPKPGSAEAEKVATFRNLVEERVREVQRQTGKEATNKDVQTIVDDLLIKAKTPNARILGLPIPFTGGEQRAFELQATRKSEIPAAAVAKIEASLRRQGLPASDDNVVEAYNLAVRGRLARGR